MNSHARIATTAAAALAVLAVGAGTAQAAASIVLKCAAAPRNEDSAGTKLCAANPGKAGKILGMVRNDAGQPVAGKVSVQFNDWIPNGTGYRIVPTTKQEIVADAAGEFTISSNTKTRQSITATLLPDPAAGIAVGASAKADVQRRFVVAVKKLGGGRVQLTVKGTKVRPMKVSVVDASGYHVPGLPKAKGVDAQNRVTFDFGSRTGKYGYYVDTGVFDDLFWPQARGTKFSV